MAVSADGAYLVCGGTDERIHIFDLATARSAGELSQHTGAVTSLKFVGTTHLLSASEDGAVCIWRTSDWECLHILGGHKAAVVDVAVHPSGKLALSLSKDHTMKLWNLVQGRCSFTRRLKPDANRIHFSGEGAAYLVVTANTVQAHTTIDNAQVCEVVHKQRVNQALFVSGSEGDGWNVLSLGEDRLLVLTSSEGEKVSTSSV
jgi:protein MAK11